MRAASAIGLGWLSAGCLVDRDRPCGDHFRESSTGTCLCREGSVPIAGRCEPEVESGPDGDSQLACEGDAGDCACQSTSQCPDGLLCDALDTGQCIPEPAGLNQSCTSDDDCTGAATYCETFSSGRCQIEGCKERDGVCPGDMACCDYAVIGRSLCIFPENLEQGSCPAPGQLVPRQSG